MAEPSPTEPPALPLGEALGVSTGCRMKSAEPTILIFRIGSLGDTVVALPCFHRIARSFPNCRRIVVTDSPISEKVAPVISVLGETGLVHGVIHFPPPPRTIWDFWSLRRRIRESGATTLVYVADRNFGKILRDICFFRACGIQDVLGAPLGRHLRQLRRDPRSGETEREAERLARCLSPLGPIDLSDSAMWDLLLQADEMRAADNALAPFGSRNFIVVSLGGKDREKDWGSKNWSALLQMMDLRFSYVGLVFVGSRDEFERCNSIAGCWNGPTVNLCGRLAPRESAAVMRRALFYLGHDCGPMHLAAAVGIPCIALFGPFNMPKWWHPMGAAHHVIHNMRGIAEITPAEVLTAVDAMISEMLRREPTKAYV